MIAFVANTDERGSKPIDAPNTKSEEGLSAFQDIMAVKREQHEPLLDKRLDGSALDTALAELGVAGYVGDVLEHLGGREKKHLLRLLGRSEAEQHFARAFAATSPEGYLRAELQNRDLHILVKAITDGEGADTTLFWTFGPYLLQHLRSDGYSDRQSMTLLYGWAADARTLAKSEPLDSAPQLRVHLRGLEYLNEGNNHVYYLDPDLNHPSHTFTRVEASEIATLVTQEQQA